MVQNYLIVCKYVYLMVVVVAVVVVVVVVAVVVVAFAVAVVAGAMSMDPTKSKKTMIENRSISPLTTSTGEGVFRLAGYRFNNT